MLSDYKKIDKFVAVKHILIFLLVGIQHMAFLYHGRMLNVFNGAEVLSLFLFLLIFFQNKCRLKKKDFAVLSIISLPMLFWAIVQFYVLHDPLIFKGWGHFFTMCISAFVIVKLMGFFQFTAYLRWWCLIDLILVAVFAVFGSVEILGANKEAYGNLIVLFHGIGFPFYLSLVDSDFIRCGGIFAHPNGLGLLSAVGMTGLVSSNLSKKKKAIWIGIFIVSFVVHESRASVLFLGVYFILYRLLQHKKSIKSKCLDLVLLFTIIIIFYSLMYLRDTTETDITSGRSSLLAQIYQSFMGESDAVQFLGVGLGNAGHYVLHAFGSQIPFDGSYLFTLIELGYIGTFIFFVSLILVLWYVERKTKFPVMIWLPFICAFCLHAVFESDFSGDKLIYIIGMFFFMACKKEFQETSS